jgi:hypothetical protein
MNRFICARCRPRFNLRAALRQLTMRGMFDTIKAELTTAVDKLDHLRRFL